MARKRKRSIRHALRNGIARDLRTPKYKPRVIRNKKKENKDTYLE